MTKLALAAALLIAPVWTQLWPQAAQAEAPGTALAKPAPYSAAATRLGVLLADPAAKAILARLFPDLLASRAVAAGYANRMTLRSLKRFRPGSFTDAKLNQADAEFARLAK